MPQAIAVLLSLILAAYALVYLLSIGLYGLFIAAPGVAVMWAVGNVAARAVGKDGAAVNFSVQRQSDGFVVIRRTMSTSPKGAPRAAGFAAGVATLAITAYMMSLSASKDPEWVRQVGTGMALVIFAFAAFWMSERLEKIRNDGHSEVCEDLSAPVAQLHALHERATIAASDLEVPGPESLEALYSRLSEIDSDEGFSAFVHSSIDELSIFEHRLRERGSEVRETKTIVRRAALHALQIGSRTALQEADDLTTALESREFRDALSDTSNDSVAYLLANIRSRANVILSIDSIDGKSQRSGHTEKRMEAEPEMLRTVGDALGFLGLPTDAKREEIKERIARMSNFYHPDKATNLLSETRESQEQVMKLLNVARGILSNAGRL